jgi:hypothetical protein
MEFAKAVLMRAEKSRQHYGRELTFETHPIIDVIKLLGRKIQTDFLSNVLYWENDAPQTYIDSSDVFFPADTPLTKDGQYIHGLKRKLQLIRQVHLGRDLVLPCPWRRSRFINCIATIGEGRLNGTWKQDETNHFVELWLPLGIAWVHGGNHSIATGIIQGVGEIPPETIYDISEVYNYVHTDGQYYFRNEDQSIISEVHSIEFATIFEIGRMMKERSISF